MPLDEIEVINPKKTAASSLELNRSGTKVIVPEGVSLRSVAEFLIRKIEEEEQIVSVVEDFSCHPADGALAVTKAIVELFGGSTSTGLPGIFGTTPPKMISVETAPGKTTQIIWGGFKVPQIEGKLISSVREMPSGAVTYRLTGEVKKKHAHMVAMLATRAREIARAESIYRAKAITMPVNDDGTVDPMSYKFIDLQGVSKDDLVFSAGLAEAIQANLFTPLENSDACRAHNIPLKRGVLLAGRYGTGKTLTARVAAKVATDNGWTFILVSRVTGLKAAIETARIYAPCVIFAEDVDQHMSGDDRTQDINDVLNTIDGIEGKKDEIITVLSTNHVESINRAMLRPGRIDALIEVTPPDADAVRTLLRKYSGAVIASDDPLTKAGEALAGQNPATIAEVAKRAKLYALGRGGDRLVVSDDDLALAAQGMGHHLALLQNNVGSTDTPATRLGNAFASLVEATAKAAYNQLASERGWG